MTYILADSDFKIISYMNSTALAAFSVASWCSSIFITFLVSWMFAENPSQELVLVTKAVLMGSGGIAVIYLIRGAVSIVKRKGHIDQIKRETLVK